jgi:hypothetical protein
MVPALGNREHWRITLDPIDKPMFAGDPTRPIPRPGKSQGLWLAETREWCVLNVGNELPNALHDLRIGS